MVVAVIASTVAIGLIGAPNWTRPKCGTPNEGQDIISEWGKTIDPSKPVLPEYPRPQLTRPESTYTNLNGIWEWEQATQDTIGHPPFGKTLNGSILVPFPVEACLSGIGQNHKWMFYRRIFDAPEVTAGGRTLVQFGAVDWQTQVYVNSQLAANHSGGYDAFTADATAFLKPKDNELIVAVFDPTEGPQPMGKQSTKRINSPGGDQYTPSSGIWQTVWLEVVPKTYITKLTLGADLKQLRLLVDANTPSGVKVSVVDAGKAIASAVGSTGTALTVVVPNPKLWSPDSPFLYDLEITLDSGDAVGSYFGMRTFGLGPVPNSKGVNVTRPLLNGKFVFHAGWLDQSWWPDGQYTAPTDEALASDIKAVKMFGLNTVRLHQKVNPDRWYYWADKLGVTIFQDFVQHFGGGPSGELFQHDAVAMMEGRGNHPCILQYTIFNERDCIASFSDFKNFDKQMLNITHTYASADPGYSRLVDGSSGGPAIISAQVADEHSYPYPKAMNAGGNSYAMVGEFGGIGAFVKGKEWVPGKCHTYLQATDPHDEASKYIAMAKTLTELKVDSVSASIYTQITDVELECDGFLNYDRSNKFSTEDTAAIASANKALIGA